MTNQPNEFPSEGSVDVEQRELAVDILAAAWDRDQSDIGGPDIEPLINHIQRILARAVAEVTRRERLRAEPLIKFAEFLKNVKTSMGPSSLNIQARVVLEAYTSTDTPVSQPKAKDTFKRKGTTKNT